MQAKSNCESSMRMLCISDWIHCKHEAGVILALSRILVVCGSPWVILYEEKSSPFSF